MTTAVDIPAYRDGHGNPHDGGVATLRDPNDLRERGRRLVETASYPLRAVYERIPDELLEQARGKDAAAEKARTEVNRLLQTYTSRKEADAFAEMGDAVIIALLLDWTIDEPLPNMDNIQELDPDVYAALMVAARDLTPAVLRRVRGTSFEPDPGEDSPFGESSPSSNGSKEEATPTAKQRRIGKSTSTAGTSGQD